MPNENKTELKNIKHFWMSWISSIFVWCHPNYSSKVTLSHDSFQPAVLKELCSRAVRTVAAFMGLGDGNLVPSVRRRSNLLPMDFKQAFMVHTGCIQRLIKLIVLFFHRDTNACALLVEGLD